MARDGPNGVASDRYSRSPRNSPRNSNAEPVSASPFGDEDAQFQAALAESAALTIQHQQQRATAAEEEAEMDIHLQAAVAESIRVAKQPAAPDVGPVINAKALEGSHPAGADASLWRSKVKLIEARYQGMRRVKGDGNCFYRSLLMGWMERLLTLPLGERSLVWTRLIPEVSADLANQMADPSRRKELLSLASAFAKRTRLLCENGATEEQLLAAARKSE